MQIVSFGYNLHEMSKPIFWKNEKYFKMSHTEDFTQHDDGLAFYIPFNII